MCHGWLVQQWALGTRFALLDKPAVALDADERAARSAGITAAIEHLRIPRRMGEVLLGPFGRAILKERRAPGAGAEGYSS